MKHSNLWRLVAIAILSLWSADPATKANGLGRKERATTLVNRGFDKVVSKIPTRWKRDPKDGRPRVCPVIEGTLGIATRVVLLGGGGPRRGKGPQRDLAGTQVFVNAESNRSALRGNLSRLSIHVRDSKSPLGLLELEGLDLSGSNLKLGWTPFCVTAGVPAMLLVPPIRQTVWTLAIYGYLWTLATKLACRVAETASSEKDSNDTLARILATRMQATQELVGGWNRRLLGGSPTKLNLELLLSNDNLANSFLLKQTSNELLEFLMQNSVLQTAAILGDAVSDSAGQTTAKKDIQANPLLLPPGQGDLGASESTTTNNNNNNNTPQMNLSRLLSATAFVLLEAPTFVSSQDGKGHLQFVSVAMLPENQARLEFVLRTTLQAGKNRSLMNFLKPECRFDVAEATSYLPLPKVVSDVLPKVVWLPIGSGVSVGGDGGETGRLLYLRDVRVMPEGNCKIRGHLAFWQQPRSGWGLVLRK